MTIIYVQSSLPRPKPRDRHPDSPPWAGLRCASCRDELRAEPVVRDNRPYCCEGCARGGPCTC